MGTRARPCPRRRENRRTLTAIGVPEPSARDPAREAAPSHERERAVLPIGGTARKMPTIP